MLRFYYLVKHIPKNCVTYSVNKRSKCWNTKHKQNSGRQSIEYIHIYGFKLLSVFQC